MTTWRHQINARSIRWTQLKWILDVTDDGDQTIAARLGWLGGDKSRVRRCKPIASRRPLITARPGARRAWAPVRPQWFSKQTWHGRLAHWWWMPSVVRQVFSSRPVVHWLRDFPSVYTSSSDHSVLSTTSRHGRHVTATRDLALCPFPPLPSPHETVMTSIDRRATVHSDIRN